MKACFPGFLRIRVGVAAGALLPLSLAGQPVDTASPVPESRQDPQPKLEKPSGLGVSPGGFPLGKITLGSVEKIAFEVKNLTKDPLIISDVRTSCGCARPDLEKGVSLNPGESKKVTVSVHSRRPGPLYGRVEMDYLTPDSSEKQTAAVELRAFVEPEKGYVFEPVPKELDLGWWREGGNLLRTVRGMLRKGDAAKMSCASSVGACEVRPGESRELGTEDYVEQEFEIVFTPPADKKVTSGTWKLSFGDEALAETAVSWRHDYDVPVRLESLVVGVLPDDGRVTRSVALAPGEKASAVTAEGDFEVVLKVTEGAITEPKKGEEGNAVALEIRSKAGVTGVLEGKAVLKDDQGAVLKEVTITGLKGNLPKR